MACLYKQTRCKAGLTNNNKNMKLELENILTEYSKELTKMAKERILSYKEDVDKTLKEAGYPNDERIFMMNLFNNLAEEFNLPEDFKLK